MSAADHEYTSRVIAALYDRAYPPASRGDYAFYLKRAMAAESVLDVGCGTGSFLAMVRDAGHSGRLVGLDPGEGMLALARQRTDVAWILGTLLEADLEGGFALAVMMGNAFQVWLTDDEIRQSLSAVRTALADGGRFAFETRNPAARGWEAWTPENAFDVTDASGATVRCAVEVTKPFKDGLISFTWTYTSPDWERPETSDSTLRFVAPERLAELLDECGLAIEEQYGDWDGKPLTDASASIITIARRT